MKTFVLFYEIMIDERHNDPMNNAHVRAANVHTSVRNNEAYINALCATALLLLFPR